MNSTPPSPASASDRTVRRGELGADRHRQRAAQAAVADRHEPRAAAVQRQAVVGGVARASSSRRDDAVGRQRRVERRDDVGEVRDARAATRCGPRTSATRASALATRSSPGGGERRGERRRASRPRRRAARSRPGSGGRAGRGSMSTRMTPCSSSGALEAPELEVGELGAGEQHGVGVAQDAVDGREAQRRAEAQRVVVVDAPRPLIVRPSGRADAPGDRQRGVAGVGGPAAEQDRAGAPPPRGARPRASTRLRVGDAAAGGRGDRAWSRRRRRRAAARRARSRCAPGRGRAEPKTSSARPRTDGSSAGSVTEWLNGGDLREQALLVGQVVDLAERRRARARHDAGDHEHRDRVLVGLGDRGDRVREARAADERCRRRAGR